MAQEMRRYARPWTPRADIYETQETVVLQLDLPGVKPRQLIFNVKKVC